jgi:hypothetical protein
MAYFDDEAKNILTSDTKGVERAEGELSKLFRQILLVKNVGGMQWQSLMEKYLNDPTNNVPTNGRDRSSMRGNMNKALMHTKMTWKVFRTGLKFLGALRFTITLNITWSKYESTEHVLKVRLFRNNLDDDFTIDQ